MRINHWAAALGGLVLSANAIAAGQIENPQPGSIESGITAITGWNCQATQITLQIDSQAPIVAPYGSQRADTSQACGGRTNTGFSYLINYNTLTPGQHTLQALADGVAFANVTFTVVTLGAEFLGGKAGEYYLNNFPDFGKRSRVTWQQSKQNFSITAADTAVAAPDGTYYGGILVTNSGCTNPSSNGTFFEPDQFSVTFAATSPQIKLVAANSANTCTFTATAFYNPNGGEMTAQNGAFSCTNGSQGAWISERMLFDPSGLLASLSLQYRTTETCVAVAHISGAR